MQATAVDNAQKLLLPNRKTTSKHKHTNRPWFDSDCKNKRITYMKAKNKYRRCNSDVNIAELKVASKSYKKDLNKKMHVYNKDMNKSSEI